jgi:hypothetical protein
MSKQGLQHGLEGGMGTTDNLLRRLLWRNDHQQIIMSSNNTHHANSAPFFDIPEIDASISQKYATQKTYYNCQGIKEPVCHTSLKPYPSLRRMIRSPLESLRSAKQRQKLGGISLFSFLHTHYCSWLDKWSSLEQYTWKKRLLICVLIIITFILLFTIIINQIMQYLATYHLTSE